MELRIRNKSTTTNGQGEMITIGMTEPNCGSDLKALLTTAEDKGDHYVVNGQKHLSLTGTCVIWL
jgi:alkylation response protein AidB-like acyl-CoA dehydrogenase